MPSKLVRRYGKSKKKSRRNPDAAPRAPRRNPAGLTDIVETLVPGFAGFAASRFVTYVSSTQVAKYKPTWAPHAGAFAAIASFLAAWLGSYRIKALEKYHLAISVGAGIAAAQSLFQIYLPQLGWVLNDPTEQIASGSAAAAAAGTAAQIITPVATAGLPPGFVPVEDPQDYVYNDSFSPGRTDQQQHRADVRAETAQATSSADSITVDDSGMDAILDEQLSQMQT